MVEKWPKVLAATIVRQNMTGIFIIFVNVRAIINWQERSPILNQIILVAHRFENGNFIYLIAPVNLENYNDSCRD